MELLWSFVLDNLEAAGAIGGYVSLSILGFTLISFASKKRLNTKANQLGPKWTHPIIGSFLGAIPGCGATIVAASLYKNKKISFGGLFATFISTLGEGSFVLLGASDEADVAGNLKAYATITIFGLLAGIIFGYLFDVSGFKANYDNNQEKQAEKQSLSTKQNTLAGEIIENIGFYAIIAMAIFLAPGSIMALWGGGIDTIADLTYWVSIALTITCMTFHFITRFTYKHDDCYCDEDDIKSTTLHAIIDIAMVVTYVFIGLVVANYVIDVLVGAETFDEWMTSSTYIVILLAALIGVMPGCGGMIAVAVAFITIPNFPMAALIAAAIATSGDGIFPLLAENKKDGLIVSLAGLAVALVVGYIALSLGF
tara:strand:- start:9709 stop:10812 length:1104 start_codon:yes stop_codon:yes gene_type:complete